MTTTNALSQPNARLLSQKPFPLQKQRFSAPPFNLASTFRTLLSTTPSSSSTTINRIIDNNINTFSATVYLSRHALFNIHQSYRLPAEQRYLQWTFPRVAASQFPGRPRAQLQDRETRPQPTPNLAVAPVLKWLQVLGMVQLGVLVVNLGRHSLPPTPWIKTTIPILCLQFNCLIRSNHRQLMLYHLERPDLLLPTDFTTTLPTSMTHRTIFNQIHPPSGLVVNKVHLQWTTHLLLPIQLAQIILSIIMTFLPNHNQFSSLNGDVLNKMADPRYNQVELFARYIESWGLAISADMGPASNLPLIQDPVYVKVLVPVDFLRCESMNYHLPEQRAKIQNSCSER